nr:immunoglobulin heavy chain junction region [Macaca mulatta]
CARGEGYYGSAYPQFDYW